MVLLVVVVLCSMASTIYLRVPLVPHVLYNDISLLGLPICGVHPAASDKRSN